MSIWCSGYIVREKELENIQEIVVPIEEDIEKFSHVEKLKKIIKEGKIMYGRRSR